MKCNSVNKSSIVVQSIVHEFVHVLNESDDNLMLEHVRDFLILNQLHAIIE